MFYSDMQVDDYAEADRREVDPPIEVEQSHGRLAANSIGGSKNAKSGGGAYAVKMAVKGALHS